MNHCSCLCLCHTMIDHTVVMIENECHDLWPCWPTFAPPVRPMPCSFDHHQFKVCVSTTPFYDLAAHIGDDGPTVSKYLNCCLLTNDILTSSPCFGEIKACLIQKEVFVTVFLSIQFNHPPKLYSGKPIHEKCW